MHCTLSGTTGTEKELSHDEYLLCVQNRTSCNQVEGCIVIHPDRQSLYKPVGYVFDYRGAWRMPRE